MAAMSIPSSVVIVGGGIIGSGIAYELAQRGMPVTLIERGRIGEAWRSARWDSFRLVTPNWMTRLPGKAYDGPEPDGFMPGGDFVAFGQFTGNASGTKLLTFKVTGLKRDAVAHVTAGIVKEVWDIRE